MLGPLLDGKTLAEALEAKKLFVVDHKIVEGLPVTHEENEVNYQTNKLANKSIRST